jgi:hypothetical protein
MREHGTMSAKSAVWATRVRGTTSDEEDGLLPPDGVRLCLSVFVP